MLAGRVRMVTGDSTTVCASNFVPECPISMKRFENKREYAYD